MWPSFRGLRWSGVLSLGILFVACGIVAALAHVAVRMAAAAISGTSIGWDALFADTLDTNNLYIPLFLAAFLLIEAVQNGWRNSAFRRVLRAGDTSTYTDIVYCCAALTRLVPVIASVSTLGLNALVKKYETGPGLAFFADLSLWFAIPGVLLVQSFVGYWLHRLMHSPLLWPMHAVHHAATDFNVITALRHHPTEGVVATLALPLVPALLGFPVEAIVIVVLATAAYTVYVHAELPTSAFIERWIAFGPNGHGIHHGKDAAYYNANFGDLVIWDRLFGTYKVDVAEPRIYGCEDQAGLYQSGRPWRDMVAVQAACCRNLWVIARGALRPVNPASVRG